MHPRTPREKWTPVRWKQANAVLDFIAERGTAHPREVDAHFAHGKAANWFGGTSNASTQLLDGMHYRGLLRVARRDSGTRVYAVRTGDTAAVDAENAAARLDALVGLIVRKYAPLPAPSLAQLLRLLGGGVPQWQTQRAAALTRAKQRLGQARVEGIDWYWPADEQPTAKRWAPDDGVRLLTPFDPVVWDRRRFEILWAWVYRFEAYTPAAKRKLGYYALPLLWRDRVIGWGNLAVSGGSLTAHFGYSSGRAPRDSTFHAELETELQRMRVFLGIED
jgi:uncharacterized protein